jgi:hypothetical protein
MQVVGACAGALVLKGGCATGTPKQVVVSAGFVQLGLGNCKSWMCAVWKDPDGSMLIYDSELLPAFATRMYLVFGSYAIGPNTETGVLDPVGV